MNKSRIFVLLIVWLSFVGTPTIANAALPSLESWTHVSSDGQFILVMVSPQSFAEEVEFSDDNVEVKRIRGTYEQSGLYRNDGSTSPIWTIPFMDVTHEVFLGPQGKYLMLAHDGGSDWSGHLGHYVTFYSDGEELASYSDVELFSLVEWILPKVARSESDNLVFDPQEMTFTVFGGQGVRIVFDVTSGQVIRHVSPVLMYVVVVILLFAGLVVIGWFMLRRQRIARQAPRDKSDFVRDLR